MKRHRIPRLVILCAAVGLLSGAALAGEEPQTTPNAGQTQVQKAEEAPANKAEEAPARKAEEAPARKAEEAPAKAEEAPARKVEEAQPNQDAGLAASAVLKAQSRLTVNLLKQLGKKDGAATVVASPSSLAGALSVIEMGAGEELRNSIPKALGFSASPMVWAEIKALRSVTSRAPQEGPLSIANAILIDEGAKPSATVLDALKKEGVSAEVRDFTKPETLRALNAWVVEKTKGLIPSIIEKLPEDGGLVTLNALYFKDRWKQTFDAALTKPAPFKLVGGKTVEAPLMQSAEGKFRFRRDNKYVGVDLPFATGGFSIAIVTTKGEPTPLEEFGAGADWLAGEGYSATQGDVRIPRLNLMGDHNLKQTLVDLKVKGLGSVTGFTKEPLRLVNAQQRVLLKLDEEGAEAAAATAISAARSIEQDFVRFLADRPFMFALRDTSSGLILVAGYVAQP